MHIHCEEWFVNQRYVFVPKLAHFGNYFRPLVAHFDTETALLFIG